MDHPSLSFPNLLARVSRIRSRLKDRRALIALAILAGGLVFYWVFLYGSGAQNPAAGRGVPPVLVEVTRVGKGRVEETVEAVGSLRANESVVISPKIAGIVESIAFTEGTNVKAGDELLRFDTDERRADLEAARLAIATARSQRDELAQKLARARTLRESGAISIATVNDLTTQVKTLETAIAGAEARERSASARLDDLILRAPFSGRVGLRLVSKGAFVDTKIAITTLDDLSQMKLDFSVPETALARMVPGAKIHARAAAFPGKAFEGILSVLDTRIDPGTRSAKATALLPNLDQTLRPGMFMNVEIRVAERPDAVMVPEEAVLAEGARQIAFTVVDGKIDRRVVEIGQRQAGKVEVKSGLKEGEILVVRGVQRVRAGMPVQTRALDGAGGPEAKTPAAKAPGGEASGKPMGETKPEAPPKGNAPAGGTPTKG